MVLGVPIFKHFRVSLFKIMRADCSSYSGAKTHSRGATVIFILPPFAIAVVVLLFYIHGKQLWSYRDGQLT